jgi:hypothetical protein
MHLWFGDNRLWHQSAQFFSAPDVIAQSNFHFAQLALHVVIAMRHDDGSDAMNEHIETAFEQLEIEPNMRIEQTLLTRFRLFKLRHHKAIVSKGSKSHRTR